MCTGMSGARSGLLVSNIILLLLGIACSAGGVVLILGRVAYGSELQFLREDLATSAASIRGDMNLNVSALDVRFVTLPLGVTLLISGILIITVSVLGIIAASGHFYKFIIVYASFLGCLFFAHIVVLVCAYIDRTPFDSSVKRYLQASLDSYTDINGEDSLTLGWNSLMSYFQCCGVDSQADFARSGYPKNVPPIIQTPVICCINKGDAPNCATDPNYRSQTYHDRGCYQHLWDYVTSTSQLIIFLIFFLIFLEYLCLFFAAWQLCLRRSQGMTKVADSNRYK